MISKGWAQTSLLRAFNNEFQKQTMLDNMVTPLFNSSEVEVYACDTDCNDDIDVEVVLETLMEENFTRVAKLSKTVNSNSMASIKEFAKRKTWRLYWSKWLLKAFVDVILNYFKHVYTTIKC